MSLVSDHQVLWSDRITVYISSLTYLIGMKRSHISGLDDLDQQFTQGFLMDHVQSRMHLFTRALSFEAIPNHSINFEVSSVYSCFGVQSGQSGITTDVGRFMDQSHC